MEKIDRLGWAAGVSGCVCGLRVGVRTNSAEVVDRLTECLPPGWEPADSPFVDLLYSFRVGGADERRNLRHYHLLYFGMQRIARTMDLEVVFSELEGHLQPRVA